MEIVLGVLALCVSLIAIWLGSTTLRRLDNDLNAFLSNARKELSSAKASIDRQVSSMADQVNTIDKQFRVAHLEATGTKTAITSLKAEIAELQRRLEALDESIPKQYRHRTAKTDSPQQPRQ